MNKIIKWLIEKYFLKLPKFITTNVTYGKSKIVYMHIPKIIWNKIKGSTKLVV